MLDWYRKGKTEDGDLKSWMPALGLVRHDSRFLAHVMRRTLTNRRKKRPSIRITAGSRAGHVCSTTTEAVVKRAALLAARR